MIKFFKRLVFNKGADPYIYFSIFVLAVLGIIMIGSACTGQTAKEGADFAITTMGKQAAFCVFGTGIMLFLAKFYKKSWVNVITCLLVYIILICAMLVCLMYEPVHNCYGWIHVPGIGTIQPSEMMKIACIIIYSYIFSDFVSSFVIPKRLKQELRNKLAIKKLFLCLVIPVMLLLFVIFTGWGLQNDLGSMLILFFVVGIVFLCSSHKYYKPLKIIILIVAFCIIPVGWFVLQGHQTSRFSSFINPLGDVNNTTFQLSNALICFSNGLVGSGFGNSVIKYGFLPESHNDFIFPIIFEELGFLGLLAVFIPYCLIIYRLYYYSMRVKEEQNRLTLIGIAAYFFAHLFINIGGASGLIPMTGIPLLLVSYGGSSVLSSLMAIGVAQGIISKYNRHRIKEQL